MPPFLCAKSVWCFVMSFAVVILLEPFPCVAGMFGASDPSRTSFSDVPDSSVPSDASGFAQYARRHVDLQRQQRQQQQHQDRQLPGADSFEGFGRQASAQSPSAGQAAFEQLVTLFFSATTTAGVLSADIQTRFSFVTSMQLRCFNIAVAPSLP